MTIDFDHFHCSAPSRKKGWSRSRLFSTLLSFLSFSACLAENPGLSVLGDHPISQVVSPVPRFSVSHGRAQRARTCQQEWRSLNRPDTKNRSELPESLCLVL